MVLAQFDTLSTHSGCYPASTKPGLQLQLGPSLVEWEQLKHESLSIEQVAHLWEHAI